MSVTEIQETFTEGAIPKGIVSPARRKPGVRLFGIDGRHASPDEAAHYAMTMREIHRQTQADRREAKSSQRASQAQRALAGLSSQRIQAEGFMGVLSEALPSIVPELRQSPAIADATFVNLDRLRPRLPDSLTLALEFCPLYRPGSLEASSLHPDPQGIEDIRGSRVGKKWDATTCALDTLSRFLARNGVGLNIQATFGDLGVLAGTPENVDAAVLQRHSALYNGEFGKYCKDRGISMAYRNLSELQGEVPTRYRVPTFVVAQGSKVVPQPAELGFKQLLDMLDLTEDHIPLDTGGHRKKAEVLGYALGNCGGVVRLWRGLVHTYLFLVPQSAQLGDIHLGMERAEWLLKLQTVNQRSVQTRMPLLNVSVA